MKWIIYETADMKSSEARIIASLGFHKVVPLYARNSCTDDLRKAEIG